MGIQTIFRLALNVKERPNDTVTYIFLHMHNINTMSNVKVRLVRKIKENGPLLPYGSLTFILFFCLSKYSIQVLNLLEDLLTSQWYRRSFVLLTSIKSFFQSSVRVMRF